MNTPIILIFHPDSGLRNITPDTAFSDSLAPILEYLSTHGAPCPTEKKYRDYLFLYHNEGFVKIGVPDIKYVTASRSYSVVSTTGNGDLLLSVPTSQITPYLPCHRFARVNRSAVVNLNYVDSLMGNTVVMSDKTRFTVSRQYRRGLFDNFQFVGTKSKKYGAPPENPDSPPGK